MPAFPSQGIDQIYMLIYGGYGYDGCGDWGGAGMAGCQCAAFRGLAAGLPGGGANPPYSVNDFLAYRAKFGGLPVLIASTLQSGMTAIVVDSTATGIGVGQLVGGPGIQNSTVVANVNGVNVTLSAPATMNGASQLSFYQAPLVPIAVMQLYLNIAFVSLIQDKKWRGQWPLAMALYIAHYCTLYLQTEGNPQDTPSQAVSNSLQAGITISQSADGVSQGLKTMEKLDNWTGWSLTQYGVQLATLARAGPGAGAAYFRG